MTDLKGSQGPMESKHIPEMKAYQHLKHLAYIDIHTYISYKDCFLQDY